VGLLVNSFVVVLCFARQTLRGTLFCVEAPDFVALKLSVFPNVLQMDWLVIPEVDFIFIQR
jgi:hypothetical protein